MILPTKCQLTRGTIGLLLAAFITLPVHAQEPKEIALKVLPVDASSKDRLLAVRVDTMGRVFIGGYDGLFVCEPKDGGGYQRRKLIYRFPERTFINDIEVRGDDLYVLTARALYVFYDGVRKREDLLPRKLLWGVAGGALDAGFQKMAWGPEGDLYFSVGSVVPEGRLGHWTFFSQPEWTKTPYRGTGGIFRCKPDGSKVQIVAGGLSHAGYFTFDAHFNAFAADWRGKARTVELWHVTPHARLGAGIGASDGLTPFHTEESSEFRAGPTYYDDANLPVELRGRLLAVRNGRILSFGVEPHGASFKATPGPTSTSAAPNVWAVGRGGRIFAVYESVDVITSADDAGQPFQPYEASEASADKLWQELNDPSCQRRYRAHIEIARRGGALLKDANKRLQQAKSTDPAFHHLVWLAAKSEQGSLHLLSLVNHADATVRVQAIRALAEFPDQVKDEPIFTKALLDQDAHVQHAAMLAQFSPKVTGGRPVQQTIERGLARSDDRLLRQTAALFLAQKATLKQLDALCASDEASARLAGVLAAGYRLTLPAQEAVPAPLPLRMGMEDGIFVVEFADGKRDLRDHGRVGTYTRAEHWKLDMHTGEQEALFKLLRKMLDDADAPVRTQAAHFLALLDDPRCAAEVARVLKK